MALDDLQSMGGAQRVAAFLLSLERKAASDLLKHLADDIVSEVVEAMEAIDEPSADPNLVRELYARVALADARRTQVSPARGLELDQLLEAGLGEERAAEVLVAIKRRRNMERPFAALEGVSAASLSMALADESPQTVAVVLAHLDPELSAAVLDGVEVERALDIVRRMAVLDPPSFEVLAMIADSLAPKIEEHATAPTPRTPNEKLQTIAEMLANATADLERDVISGIETESTEMARDIREMMFTWDDIADVDRRAMQKILGTVETRTLSIAMKACNSVIEDNIMGNLSTRVRDMVREERELAGAVPMSEVRSARDEIMRGVRVLIESGEFKPSKGGDELVA